VTRQARPISLRASRGVQPFAAFDRTRLLALLTADVLGVKPREGRRSIESPASGDGGRVDDCRRLRGALVASAAVSLARVYRGMHHPSDVIAGALLGFAVLAVAFLAVRSGPTDGG
jgi:hypothetical protein